MERRELLRMITMLTGGALVGGELFLSGCTSAAPASMSFTPTTVSLLDEVGETILPATSSPGAKAAQVGEFMKRFVTDCYTAAEQEAFLTGVKQLDEASIKMNGKSFMKSTPEERHALLVALETEAKKHNEEKAEREHSQREDAKKQLKKFEPAPPHYYTMFKQLTLLGFFTSKTGATETLRHVAVPGKYDGAYPYKKGDKAWSD